MEWNGGDEERSQGSKRKSPGICRRYINGRKISRVSVLFAARKYCKFVDGRVHLSIRIYNSMTGCKRNASMVCHEGQLDVV